MRRRGRADRPAATADHSGPTADHSPAASTDPLLSIRHLRKSFGSNLVLDDVSLDVQQGNCVVLIGASGSGKSTLLRCVNLLEVVDDGVIELAGTDITDPRVNADEVRSRVGIVFQAFNLFPHLSVLQNVTLSPIKVHGLPRAEAEARATAILERIGLSDKATAKPDELSGGQQQRVAIARALVNSPVLMLLDEVTSALDPELVGEVLSLLRELKDEGMTMLIATHEMGFARQVADTVCFLDGGRLLEAGPPSQVLHDPQQPRTRQFLSRIIEAGRL
jgi:polar amino acid transport system ATP-binding protein